MTDKSEATNPHLMPIIKLTEYPFPDGDNDILKQKFGIELREYTFEHKEAAANAWTEFCRNQVDSSMFIKLIALCDGSLTEATVLWDLLKFHRTTGNKLKGWRSISVQFYVEKHGKEFGAVRSYNRALDDLGASGLIIHWPVQANVPRKFRLDWIEFSQRLVEVSTKLPSLDAMPKVLE